VKKLAAFILGLGAGLTVASMSRRDQGYLIKGITEIMEGRISAEAVIQKVNVIEKERERERQSEKE